MCQPSFFTIGTSTPLQKGGDRAPTAGRFQCLSKLRSVPKVKVWYRPFEELRRCLALGMSRRPSVGNDGIPHEPRWHNLPLARSHFHGVPLQPVQVPMRSLLGNWALLHGRGCPNELRHRLRGLRLDSHGVAVAAAHTRWMAPLVVHEGGWMPRGTSRESLHGLNLVRPRERGGRPRVEQSVHMISRWRTGPKEKHHKVHHQHKA